MENAHESAQYEADPGRSCYRDAGDAGLRAVSHKHDPMQRPIYNTVQPGRFGQVETYSYPNGASRTGTAASIEAGAEFNLLSQPNID